MTYPGPGRGWWIAAGFLALLGQGLVAERAVAQVRDLGRTTVPLAERSNAGDWEGTWYFVTRSEKVAIWIREGKKGPELQLQYLSTDRPEGFKTGWNGRVKYEFRRESGELRFDLTQRDADTIRGDWYWKVGPDERARIETAKITMYRVGEGRHMIMNFEELERVHKGPPDTRLAYDQVWTFLKASNRLVRWEELPF